MSKQNRIGWDSLPNEPTLLFTESAAGSLAAYENSSLVQSPLWRGVFFNNPGIFNRPDIIKNAGGGYMQVLQNGIYFLSTYITTGNGSSASETNVRFRILNSAGTSTVIANSTHQIYEFGDNNDRDFLSKGVYVYLHKNDLVTCELNSNKADHSVRIDSNWMMELKSGLVGNQGPNGSYSIATDAINVYRNANSPTDTNLSVTPKNIFIDDDLSVHVTENYDVQGTFDVSTALWTPRAGKYLVQAGGGFSKITDTAFVFIMLYDYTHSVPINYGYLGRNAGISGDCVSSLSCQISADGSTTYGLYAQAINDNLIEIIGDGYSTFLTAHRFTVTP